MGVVLRRVRPGGAVALVGGHSHRARRLRRSPGRPQRRAGSRGAREQVLRRNGWRAVPRRNAFGRPRATRLAPGRSLTVAVLKRPQCGRLCARYGNDVDGRRTVASSASTARAGCLSDSAGCVSDGAGRTRSESYSGRRRERKARVNASPHASERAPSPPKAPASVVGAAAHPRPPSPLGAGAVPEAVADAPPAALPTPLPLAPPETP